MIGLDSVGARARVRGPSPHVGGLSVPSLIHSDAYCLLVLVLAYFDFLMEVPASHQASSAEPLVGTELTASLGPFLALLVLDASDCMRRWRGIPLDWICVALMSTGLRISTCLLFYYYNLQSEPYFWGRFFGVPAISLLLSSSARMSV
jgi:hypothetical protein